MPAAAAAALALGLVLQFALPAANAPGDLAMSVMRMPRLVTPPAEPVRPDVLAAPIFSPDRKPGPDADAAPGASILDGYAALGVAMGRGFTTAVVKGPDGTVKTLRLGADLEGWRLIALDRVKITLQKNDARHVLTVGAPALQAGQGGEGQKAGAPGQAGANDE